MLFRSQNVKTMKDMFCNCTSLVKLDVSSFDTQNVTSMNNMFWYCYILVKVIRKNFNKVKIASQLLDQSKLAIIEI